MEPVAGVLGASLASHIRPILPNAAGAMIFVVVEELIPELRSANWVLGIKGHISFRVQFS